MVHKTGVNYYEILEVDSTAPPSEIHRAYQKARATYSPENPALYSMFTDVEAQELLRLVEEAYQVLGNNTRRRNYDIDLGIPTVISPNMPDSGVHNLPERFGASEPAPQVAKPAPPPTTLTPSDISPHYQVRKRDPSLEPLPPGMGRTALGTYPLDEKMEREIESATDFDGPFLSRIRTYKKITLEQLVDLTRISRTYLAAVESNNFKALPASVFVRGFIVQIARALGLSETRVASSYMKNFKAGGGK